ncbi:MAG: PAS domain-containing protein [Nitrospirae bacterium]|nr:PAS domain-containing protein [Nitrospirota bacterium]
MISLHLHIFIDIVGSLAVIYITFQAVRTGRSIALRNRDIIFYRYLYYQAITLFVFASGRAFGHIIKRILLLTDNQDIWALLSPLSGGLNTLTFIAFSLIALMYSNVQDVNRQIDELITERRRYKRLFDYKTKIFDSMYFPAVVISEDYKILDVNRRFVEICKDKNKAELIGKNCYEVTHSSSVPCLSEDHPCPIKKVINEGTTEVVMHRHRCPEGDRIFELHISPVLFGEREVKAVIEICRDITEILKEQAEKERLRKQLFQTQKMASLQTLIAGIAHEFNNLLVGIMGNAELILNMPADAGIRERVEKISSSSQRAAELIKKMLYYQSAVHSEKQPFNLKVFLLDFQKFVHSIKPEEVDVKFILDIEDLIIYGDPQSLNDAFINIVENAFQAMIDGGRLDIEVRKTIQDGKPYVMLAFMDTGEGIAPENLDRVFDPFFTTRDVGSGTGLGLYVAKGVVESHDGKIVVESTQGEGTRFTVYLPYKD